ncbi:hypothetical protein ACVW1C_000256 [Bradyrhizobium sp. USDA 4011]
MSGDAPLQLKPRLSVSIDQAQAIVNRAAPGATVRDVIALRDVDIPVPRILLADDTRSVIGASASC